MKPSWRRLMGLLIVLSALVLAVAGCGGGDDDDEAAATTAAGTTETTGGGEMPAVVLGTKNFTEQFILGELYKQALEAKGFKVTLKSNIGSTEVIDKALTSGQINMYPEYTGTALTVVFGAPGSEDTAEATYDAAKMKYAERGQTLLDMTPFSDSDAIAVLKTTADQYGLKTVGDLKKVPNLTLGGQPQFSACAFEQAQEELRDHEGQVRPGSRASARTRRSTRRRSRRPGIFSTDPPLASGKYVVLEDTEAQFGFQNVAPVVDQELADSAGDEFADTLNAVSEKLTEDAIIAMNSAVAIDQQQLTAVAKKFLEEQPALWRNRGEGEQGRSPSRSRRRHERRSRRARRGDRSRAAGGRRGRRRRARSPPDVERLARDDECSRREAVARRHW